MENELLTFIAKVIPSSNFVKALVGGGLHYQERSSRDAMGNKSCEVRFACQFAKETHVGRPDLNELVKQIVSRVPCSVCSRPFELDDIHVLGQRGDVWLLAIYCSHCDTRALVFAQMQVEEGTPQVSEPSPAEQEWFESLPPISVDDVLDVHRFLQDFEGDVYDLLGVHRAGSQDEWD